MDKGTQSGLDYSNGEIGKLFRKIFFPTLLGMLFTALITIVDGIFVGQGVGPDGIASVNIIVPLYMIATGIGLMMGTGASVRAGMVMARGDTVRTNSIVSQSLLSVTILMTLIIVIILCWPVETARMMGSSDRLLHNAIDYLTWLIPATLFVSWSCIGMMVIRLDGSPKYAMMINVIPAIINIAGDYVLIFPCGMGVKGAAIATAGSVAIGGLMSIFYFTHSYLIKLSMDLRMFWQNLWSVVSVGSSAFVTEVAMSIMILTGNIIFMRYFGDSGVAAYSIACYLFPLFFMMSNAVAQSAQPIISYNKGIEATHRVQSAFRLSRRVAIICGTIIFAGIALETAGMVSLFIPVDSSAGILAVKGLPIFSICAVFFALNIAYIGYYQSVGESGRAMMYTLLRGVILLIPLFYIMSALFPTWGMWASIPAAEFITFLIILISWHRI